MKERTRIIGLATVGVFAVLQLFPIDKTNPSSDPAQDFITLENPPEQIASIMKNACYDCHSYHTKYPWYTNLQPVGWWIEGHYREGREHFNLSEWGSYEADKKQHKMEEAAEEVEATKMPLMPYWVMHPEAKLSADDRKMLVDYFESKSR